MSLKIEQYYLDLKKVGKIKSDSERDKIHRYYLDLMHAANDGKQQQALSLAIAIRSTSTSSSAAGCLLPAKWLILSAIFTISASMISSFSATSNR